MKIIIKILSRDISFFGHCFPCFKQEGESKNPICVYGYTDNDLMALLSYTIKVPYRSTENKISSLTITIKGRILSFSRVNICKNQDS